MSARKKPRPEVTPLYRGKRQEDDACDATAYHMDRHGVGVCEEYVEREGHGRRHICGLSAYYRVETIDGSVTWWCARHARHHGIDPQVFRWSGRPFLRLVLVVRALACVLVAMLVGCAQSVDGSVDALACTSTLPTDTGTLLVTDGEVPVDAALAVRGRHDLATNDYDPNATTYTVAFERRGICGFRRESDAGVEGIAWDRVEVSP